MTNNIRQESLAKSILRLAIPVSLQQLMVASLNLVDTTMVVQLGNISTAAIGAAGRWFFLFNLFNFGFASGMSVLVAQYWGVKDEDNIRSAYGFGLVNAVVVAVIFTTLAQIMPETMMRAFTNEAPVIAEGAKYLRIATWAFIPLSFNILTAYVLRSTERVVLPLIASFVSVIINTTLNYILIFGKLGFPAMGIEGAGTATAISSSLQLVLLLSVSVIRKSIIASHIKSFIPKTKAFILKYYKFALPVLVNEVFWALGFNAYCMVLARQGHDNYAAYTIFASVEQVIFTLFVGVCSACAILVGKRVGANKIDDAYKVAKKFLIGVPVGGIVAGGLLVLISGPIIGLMNVETAYTAHMAQRLMLIYSGLLWAYLFPYIAIVGVFRAGGDTKIGLVYDLSTLWLVGVPMVYLAGMVFHLPFEITFGLMYVESIVKSVLCIRHFKRKKWLIRITA